MRHRLPRGMLLYDTPIRVEGRWYRWISPATRVPLRWWDLWFWLAIVCRQAVTVEEEPGC